MFPFALPSSIGLTAFAIVTAVLTGAVGVQTYRLNSSQKTVAEVRLEVAQRDTLITTQNAAVAGLKAKSDAQATSVAAAQAETLRIGKNLQAKLAALRAERVPADCEGAVNWAAEQAPAIAADWGKQ